MSIFDDIRRDREAGTPGPWSGHNMVHAECRSMTPEEIGEYVCNSVKMGDQGRFLFISAPHSDGDSVDVCHTGNGPRGPANTARIARVPELERIALAAEELAKVFRDIVGYLEGLIEDGCPKCGGDCAGANPPVAYCPMKSMSNDLEKARSALAAFRGTTR